MSSVELELRIGAQLAAQIIPTFQKKDEREREREKRKDSIGRKIGMI